MAPKRPIEEEDDFSSSEEEKEVSDTQNPNKSDSEEEEESSSEEEREALERDNNTVKRSFADATTDDDVEVDDVSGSDTDTSPPSPTASAFTIKPSKPNPNSNSAQSILAPKSAEKKENSLSEQKKLPMTWTEDGEAAVLEGCLEFRKKKGVDPSSNWEAFYLFVKKMIPFDVTKSQVIDKIRRLRKKYLNNALKGDSVVFAKPRDGKLFELSKKVWGGDDNGVKNGKRKVSGSVVEREGDGEKSPKSVKKEDVSKKSLKKAKKEESLEEEVKEVVVQNGVSEEGLDGLGFWDRYPRLKMALDNENFGGFSEEVKRAGEADLSRISHDKAKELEGKWKLYQVKVAELKMMWLDIVREQTKLVIEELAKP